MRVITAFSIKFFLGACLFLGSFSSTSLFAATYYVDPVTGDDLLNNGSISTPFKTIQKSVDVAIAGDTVYLRGGTYREDVEATVGGGSVGNYVNIFAYNSEIPVVKGSQVVTGWVQESGNIWKKTGWIHNSQQVFVDFDANPSQSLQQIGLPSEYYTAYEYPNPVGNNLADMAPGRFYYASSTQTLYVQLLDNGDPNAHTMEVSTERRLFYMGRPYFHLKGITFRHTSGSQYDQQTVAVELSSHSIIENCDIQYTDFAGLAMGYNQSNTVAIGNTVSNNGSTGIAAANSSDFTIRGNTIKSNNTRNFYALWNAGGIKVTGGQSYGLVELNEVANNNGSGIWFDYANGGNPISVIRNYVHDNGPVDAAIFFEVSKNGLIANNIIANNSRRAIYLAAADNTRVINNTIYNIPVRAAIEVAGVPRSGATLTNNQIYNNTISETTAAYDLFYAQDSVPNGSSDNTGDYNNIFRSAGSLQLSGDGATPLYISVAAWSAATTKDTHSISVVPAFIATVPTATSQFQLLPTSLLIDTGTSSVIGAGIDFLENPIYGTPDIGAYEYQPPYSIGVDKIDVQAGARIYGDGKFRALGATSTNLADLQVTPLSGNFTVYGATTTRPEWLTITDITWNKSGDYYKRWTESSSVVGGSSTIHVVGDLRPNTIYTLKRDGLLYSTLTSDSQGKAAFVYSGGYSSHTFDLTEFVSTGSSIISSSGGGYFVNSGGGSGYTPPQSTSRGVIGSTTTPPLPTPSPILSTENQLCPNDFIRNLTYGSVGIDVKKLQKFLNADPRTRVATSGAGSPGKETSTFFFNTYKAVLKYQKLHLKELEVVHPTGNVYQKTRKLLNECIR